MKYPKNCDIFHYDFEPLDPRLKKEDKREFFRTFAKSNKHIFKVITSKMEAIPMEHIYIICRVEPKLQLVYICSIRILPVTKSNLPI